jgi:hypothetical protein
MSCPYCQFHHQISYFCDGLDGTELPPPSRLVSVFFPVVVVATVGPARLDTSTVPCEMDTVLSVSRQVQYRSTMYMYDTTLSHSPSIYLAEPRINNLLHAQGKAVDILGRHAYIASSAQLSSAHCVR